jgi:hypothetical protein
MSIRTTQIHVVATIFDRFARSFPGNVVYSWPSRVTAVRYNPSILGLVSSHDLGLQQIPLDRIVGSVGKYQEFSRSFLPRLTRNKERWKGVFVGALDVQGLPPIDVYQVGEVYFVIDGNHRVSVARQLGATTIEAYVTKLSTGATITSDTALPTLILEAEKIRFRIYSWSNFALRRRSRPVFQAHINSWRISLSHKDVLTA